MIGKGYKQSKEWVDRRVAARSWYKPTEDSRKRMSESKKGEKNPFYGHKWTEKQRSIIPLSHTGMRYSSSSKRKISIANINYYKLNPEARPVGKKNPMYGKPVSLQMRERLREKSLKFYENNPEIRKKLGIKYSGKNNPFYGKHHDLRARELMKEKRRFRVIPVMDTNLEKTFQSKLFSEGIEFKKHPPIYGQPDIFIEPNICVFVDGCFWHGCETCKKGSENKNRVIRRQIDYEVVQKLESLNYVVLRFWEHEIEDNIENCINLISKQINKIS